MPSKKLKIVSITSEVSPFSKTGGLGDVARSLPKAIKRLGHEVIVVTPLYGKVIDKKKHELKLIHKDVEVYLNSRDTVKISYWKGYLMKGLPVYFIENKKYFSQRKDLYVSSHENARFLIFNVAALKLVSLLKFEADIVHCHDWQTGLIPYYLKTEFRYSKTLRKAKTIFTIHNLIFQFGQNWWEVLPKNKDYGRSRIPHLKDKKLEYINFAKRAILCADAISTVSEQYREEIMTQHFGQDLHRILRNRKDRLFGIVNGISYADFNPAKDKSLYVNFSHKKIHRKKLNKQYVQKKFKLTIDENTPLICATSRVTFQKGFELLIKVMRHLMKLNVQMIILGEGDKNYIKEFKKVARKHPKKLVILPTHEENQKYETLAYAGSDLFLLPSHQEPCGINQMKAMRYGCVPIVRKVGGLNDTVEDYNGIKQKGTGFVFSDFDKYSLYRAIIRALETYNYKEIWRDLVVRVMQESNSWEIPAKKYVSLYKKAMKLKNGNSKNGNGKKKNGGKNKK